MKMEHDHMPPEQPLAHAQRSPGEGLPGSAMQQLPPVGSAATSAVASPTSQTSLDRPHDVTLPPLALSFPGDPSAELAPIQPPHEKPADAANQTLPPLSSVTGAQHAPLPTSPEPMRPASHIRPTNHWPSLNPFTTYYTPSYLDPAESSSPSMGSEHSVGRKPPSVSLDDPDVRIAAEALGQMRTDCGASPRNRSTASSSTLGDRKSSKGSNTASPSPSVNRRNQPEQEPLLSLITTSHPLVATTIGSAASVYNTSKNYSPHLKTGAEYVESYLKPVGKAVGSVSRKTGVEGGMRWIFGIRSRKQRASTDIETGERGNSKRLKSERNSKGRSALDTPTSESTDDLDGRRTSISTVDTLPVYDDQRSPAYTEVADDKGLTPPGSYPSGQQRWPQRFVVTTSGLGVAMKQESLKSLRYCLTVLRDTNGHIGGVVAKLKDAIDEYDRARSQHHPDGDGDGDDQAMASASSDTNADAAAASRNRLVQLMKELRDDIFNVIHQTVQTVSKYAGSALPENARNLVQRQLMSLPGIYQFHYVRESEGRAAAAAAAAGGGDSGSGSGSGVETGARDSAHLALLFAREALLLMTQVGDVLNRTLVSAEQWCEALYSRGGQAEAGGEQREDGAVEDEEAAALDAEALRAALGGVALKGNEQQQDSLGGAPDRDIVMSG